MSIFVTSDWHFCHSKPFLWEKRGFASVEEMNEAIIARHNEVVGAQDDVYVLGDCVLNNTDEGIRLIERMNGHLHIIIGNHDTDNRISAYKYARNIFEIDGAKRLKYKKFSFYLSHYPTLCSNFDYEKPLRSRVINLCGHTHTKNPWCDWDKGLIFHCEMDTNDCMPWNLDDIIILLESKYELEGRRV